MLSRGHCRAECWRRNAVTCLAAIAIAAPNLTMAQESTPLATATAMQRLVVEAIERAENSVVAIARVRREASQPLIADEIGMPVIPGLGAPDPTDRAFVPSEFG